MAEIGKANIEVSIKDLTREQLADITRRIKEATVQRNIEIGANTPSGISRGFDEKSASGVELSSRANRIRAVIEATEKELAKKPAEFGFEKESKALQDRLNRLQIGLKRLEEGIVSKSQQPIDLRKIEFGKGAAPNKAVIDAQKKLEQDALEQAKRIIKIGVAIKATAAGFRGATAGLEAYQRIIEEGGTKTDAINAALAEGGRKLVASLPLIGGLLDSVVDFALIIEGSTAEAARLQEEINKNNRKAKEKSDALKDITSSVDIFTAGSEKELRDAVASDVEKKLFALNDAADAEVKKIAKQVQDGLVKAEDQQRLLIAVSSATYQRRQQILKEAGDIEIENQKKLQATREEVLRELNSLDFKNEPIEQVSKFNDQITDIRQKFKQAQENLKEKIISQSEFSDVQSKLEQDAKDAGKSLMDSLAKGLKDGTQATAERISQLEINTARSRIEAKAKLAESEIRLGKGSEVTFGSVSQAKEIAAIDRQAILAKLKADLDLLKIDFDKKLKEASVADRIKGGTGEEDKVKDDLNRLSKAIRENAQSQIDAANLNIRLAEEERDAKIKNLKKDEDELKKKIDDQLKIAQRGGGGFSTLSATQAAFKASQEVDKTVQEIEKSNEELRKINQNLVNLKQTFR